MALRNDSLFSSLSSAVEQSKKTRMLPNYGDSVEFENTFRMPPLSPSGSASPLSEMGGRVEQLPFPGLSSAFSRSSDDGDVPMRQGTTMDYLEASLSHFNDTATTRVKRSTTRSGAWYEEQHKKGTFSKKERDLVDTGMIAVLQEEGLPYDFEFRKEFVTRKKNQLPKRFWVRVAAHVPGRSAQSVYDHAKRRLEPKNYKSLWSNEEVEELARLIRKHGTKWVLIGEELGRLPGACRDKWRDVLRTSGFRPQAIRKGRFTNEEEALLLSLVMQSREAHNGEIDWTEVASKMGTRSYRQCRRFYFNRAMKMSFPSQNPESDLELVERLCNLDVEDESEVRWAELDPQRTREQVYERWRLLYVLSRMHSTTL
ncbi:Myb-like DNA-binding protein REB1 [Galdieria sulphuraria]|uniref:Myb-like DNA-binding protein REB1 n=1 Tax=Galdieria sulphuraria TaxID=130081 RepID=M2Y5G2_GALSU|nr:Myb-like DNA-binding protein REB1 [Galdieria sulphuraria]EME31094.1 Myb-like DNA-binding protein REB1 [Galdieria sulphuraria]|eukprot:XP_005707614.1 Myb-like DNA-binding protein REB1 [Galdieria sulphuraria]